MFLWKECLLHSYSCSLSSNSAGVDNWTNDQGEFERTHGKSRRGETDV